MLLPQKVTIKWVARRKEYYTKRGYVFTGIGDEFALDVEDLQSGSEIKVRYVCDYCHKIKEKPYRYITKAREQKVKDCCGDTSCQNKKRADTRTVPISESFGEKYPELVEQWEYSKNNKTPYDYYPNSGSKVWWKCSKGHVWEASMDKRGSLGRGCHYCTGRQVDESNSLYTVRPDVSVEWDHKKNGSLTPNDVTENSGSKVWWVCEKGHSWKAKIANRSHGSGCPVCNESTGERLVREWLEEKGIGYKREVSLSDLKGIRGGELRFDFALLDEQGYIKAFLEFDGIFHFQKVYEGDGHETIVKHDELKNRFCEEEKIKLIRIPYDKLPVLDQELEKQLYTLYQEVLLSVEH